MAAGPALDTAEHRRLRASAERGADWKNWGPYVAERAWGTVREDYSPDGSAWTSFPHDHARSRAYRWSEDGMAGFCNRHQNITLTTALWNGQDRILKERLFGLSGPEGNHGEDVKELYSYLDGVPSHAYMRMRYLYPIDEFPYADLVAENARRGYEDEEYEIEDAMARQLAEHRYFEVEFEWAKGLADDDLILKITARNCAAVAAPLTIMPHAVFRNTWSWREGAPRPKMWREGDRVAMEHRHLGRRSLSVWQAGGSPADTEFIFTENDTNCERLYNVPNASPFVKDAFHAYIVEARDSAVNPDAEGTKVAAVIRTVLAPQASTVVWLRFSPTGLVDAAGVTAGVSEILTRRRAEADEFYAATFAVYAPLDTSPRGKDQELIQRQAFAGLLWSKTYYHFSVELWLKGDPGQPRPPPSRWGVRNTDWMHLYASDVISVPDSWEYPWFAAWDLAFHCVPLAIIDPEWAKRQLILLLREWYMHPNGQIPAYEWSFSDCNPPVHAWAALRVYEHAQKVTGHYDTVFLEKIFHKLLLNFSWWCNRKDKSGKNVFEGGFLGLDNIGVFDRSKPLPTGGTLEQSDGSAWMAMFSLNMLAIAIELAMRVSIAYEDIATKFLEHFVVISHSAFSHTGANLWSEADGLFFDALCLDDGVRIPLKIRSFVCLIPLFAGMQVSAETLARLPEFKRRIDWFLKYRTEMMPSLPSLVQTHPDGHLYLTAVSKTQLLRIASVLFDPAEFLSDYGVRSLSRVHRDRPYVFHFQTATGVVREEVAYTPSFSTTGIMGGNSSWRGPTWIPVNALLFEALLEHHRYYGESLQVEVPRGSGRMMNLRQAAFVIAERMLSIFTLEPGGKTRRCYGGKAIPGQVDAVQFSEYFDGDNGAGVGAKAQLGWTSLIGVLSLVISAEQASASAGVFRD